VAKRRDGLNTTIRLEAEKTCLTRFGLPSTGVAGNAIIMMSGVLRKSSERLVQHREKLLSVACSVDPAKVAARSVRPFEDGEVSSFSSTGRPDDAKTGKGLLALPALVNAHDHDCDLRELAFGPAISSWSFGAQRSTLPHRSILIWTRAGAAQSCSARICQWPTDCGERIDSKRRP
jgi:hypothetical protein